MPKYPYRKAGSTWDRTFRNSHNQNLSDIADDIRGSYNALNAHAKASKAHKSSQIAHGDGLSVSQEIEIAKARIRNLVLETDGTNVKEVVDSRVDKKGTIYPMLRDRLNANETVVENLNSIIQQETTFDYTTVPPVYHTTLNLKDPTVLQCFVIDEETGDIYATQVSYGAAAAGIESFTITRMNQNGVMLDSMKIVNGGHGTTIGLEREGSKLYIWSNYDVVDSSGKVVSHDLVRFPYSAGATLTGANGSITRYNKFNDKYTIPVIDQKNGLIAFRIKGDNDSSTLELRNLSDVKKGVDKKLGTIIVPTDLTYLQGFTIDGYDAYWYTGDTNSQSYPSELVQFSFKDGALKKRITCDFGRDADGSYEGDFREPESIYLYKDPITGKKSLFAGVVTGTVGKRIAKVYAYHSKENAAKFATDLSAGYQGYALSKNNGSSKNLPDGLTSLSTFRQVGYYYMKTAETKTLTDHPNPGDAGWWLNVMPADSSGTVIQTLTRNSTGRDTKIYTRVVTNAGVGGKWIEVMTSQKLSWTNLPLKNGASNPDSNNKLQYAVNGGMGYIRGRVNIPKTDGVVFATLPSEARPSSSSWYQGCQVGGTTGDRKVAVRSNGEVAGLGFAVNNIDSVTYTYVNICYPLN